MLNREELRRYIENSGLKQKHVADRARMPECTLSLILSGKRKCNVDEYVRLCASLDVPIGTFIVHQAS